MRNVRTKVYRFEELSEQAKREAKRLFLIKYPLSPDITKHLSECEFLRDGTEFTNEMKPENLLLFASTKKEVERLLSCGMRQISSFDLKVLLNNLGYKIDIQMCSNYTNSSNENRYKARMMGYTDIKTGLSWAHYTQEKTNRENQIQLQEIRRNCFVFESGVLWEL